MIVKTHIYDLFTKETFLGRPYYPRAGPWKKRRNFLKYRDNLLLYLRLKSILFKLNRLINNKINLIDIHKTTKIFCYKRLSVTLTV